MIIFINGPPGSGKTTAIGWLIADTPTSASYNMNRPVREALAALMCVDTVSWRRVSEYYKNDKLLGTPMYEKSPVETELALNKFLLDHFGPTAIGYIACLGLKQMIFRHCFIAVNKTVDVEEIVNRNDCACIQLERPGCSFDGIDGEYIDCDKLDIPVKVVANRHELDMFREQIKRATAEWLAP